MGKIESLGDKIEYKGSYNPSPIKRMLGLENGLQINVSIPSWEKLRLGLMLQRANYLTSDEIIILRDQIPHEDNPWEKRGCQRHGEWYHDAFGCMHHEHIDGKRSDRRPIDRAPKDPI